MNLTKKVKWKINWLLILLQILTYALRSMPRSKSLLVCHTGPLLVRSSLTNVDIQICCRAFGSGTVTTHFNYSVCRHFCDSMHFKNKNNFQILTFKIFRKSSRYTVSVVWSLYLLRRQVGFQGLARTDCFYQMCWNERVKYAVDFSFSAPKSSSLAIQNLSIPKK